VVSLLALEAACTTSRRATEEIPPSGPITIAVVGDTLLTRPIDLRDAGVAAVRDLLRGATLAVANLNVNVLEDAPPARGPEAPSWPFARPRDAAALRELGVDVVSLANDHATDHGADGLASTRRALSRAGLLDVGAGPDLAAARRPLFVGRSADGRARVAVVALAASSTAASRATASRADILGRAGLNPLRYAPDITADPKTFQALAETASAVGGGGLQGGDALSLFGTTIKKGDRTTVEFVVDERDEREILETIRSARREAEFVVVSVHSHEPANASAEPAEFFRRFARRAIDAGAHAIVGHGPHRIRAVEAYGGGIILYSVGDFVYQTTDVKPGAPSDFDGGADLYALALGATSAPRPPDPSSGGASLLAELAFIDGGLTAVRLEALGIDADGVPRVAAPEMRAAIFEDLARLSAGSGTAVQAAGAAAATVVLRPHRTQP
jgi:poly-gamma-glutamate synthesis protein (capsule biosynthesis protein)